MPTCALKYDLVLKMRIPIFFCKVLRRKYLERSSYSLSWNILYFLDFSYITVAASIVLHNSQLCCIYVFHVFLLKGNANAPQAKRRVSKQLRLLVLSLSALAQSSADFINLIRSSTFLCPIMHRFASRTSN